MSNLILKETSDESILDEIIENLKNEYKNFRAGLITTKIRNNIIKLEFEFAAKFYIKEGMSLIEKGKIYNQSIKITFNKINNIMIQLQQKQCHEESSERKNVIENEEKEFLQIMVEFFTFKISTQANHYLKYSGHNANQPKFLRFIKKNEFIIQTLPIYPFLCPIQSVPAIDS
jgi:hypothetical protein